MQQHEEKQGELFGAPNPGIESALKRGAATRAFIAYDFASKLWQMGATKFAAETSPEAPFQQEEER